DDVAYGNAYRYDDAGRLTLAASPAAVNLPSDLTDIDANSDPLNFANGRSPYLRLNAGEIKLVDHYADGTTAPMGTNAGGVAGYLKDHALSRGELSLPISISS